LRGWIRDGKYEEALSVARQQVAESGAQILDVNMMMHCLDGSAYANP